MTICAVLDLKYNSKISTFGFFLENTWKMELKGGKYIKAKQ